MSAVKFELGKGAVLDASIFVDTRMLITANSGGGKSWQLRLMAEQLAPKMQTIIVDPEGEFLSLRELVDVVLVSQEGEIVPDVRNAHVLARKLLELGVSAVIDLYELSMSDRRQFVKLFLNSMMTAPKKLWHPCIVILDEAHKFCPERSSGQADSTDAVITLLSQGRKRGFCGVLATQRISKLHKDAVAECNNNLVGRTTLDVDVHRARDILGLNKSSEAQLRHLPAGHWFGFGPAFVGAGGVVQFQGGKVRTTHPGSGERYKLEPPAPSARIKRVLPELHAIPQELKAEEDELSSLRKQVKDLRAQISASGRGTPKTAPAPSVDRSEIVRRDRAYQAHDRRVQTIVGRSQDIITRLNDTVKSSTDKLLGELAQIRPYAAPVDESPTVSIRRTPMSHAANSAPAVGRSGKLRMLKVIAQYPDGVDRVQLGIMADVKSSSGTFGTYLGALKTEGLIIKDGNLFLPTQAGIAALGADFEPLPTGRDLVRYWQNKIGGEGSGLRRMLDALIDAGARGLERAELAEAAGIAASSGTFGTYLGKLRSLNLAEGRNPIVIAEVLR
jgi:hypothetical protein